MPHLEHHGLPELSLALSPLPLAWDVKGNGSPLVFNPVLSRFDSGHIPVLLRVV